MTFSNINASLSQPGKVDRSRLGMLVVIDRSIDDIQTLVKGVKLGAEVLILDEQKDSIAQITQALTKEKFTSLHFVSHGAPGVLFLGNSSLTLDNLNR